MRIHDKPRILGEFVVEGAAAGVGGVGDPVDARAVLLGCGGIDGLDEVCVDAGEGVEVLQVAHIV